MGRTMTRKLLRRILVILLAIGLCPFLALGVQPATSSAPANLDAFTRDLLGHAAGWQEALELSAPDITVDGNTIMQALRVTLSEDSLRKLERDQVYALVRLVGLKNIRDARPVLRERMYDPNTPRDLRREIAQSFARIANDSEILEMLDSATDEIAAIAVDWAGDREAPVIRSRIDEMLAKNDKYWGTDTGGALGKVGFLRLLMKRWEADPSLEARLSILVSAKSFMFDGRNLHWRNAPSNTSVGRWMRLRLQELYAIDPQRVAEEMRERGKENDLFLYIERELSKPRSAFFARTQPAQASRPAPN